MDVQAAVGSRTKIRVGLVSDRSSPLYAVGLCAASLVFMPGCSSILGPQSQLGKVASASSMKGSVSSESRVAYLERELRKRQAEINDLRERNLVLEQKLNIKVSLPANGQAPARSDEANPNQASLRAPEKIAEKTAEKLAEKQTASWMASAASNQTQSQLKTEPSVASAQGVASVGSEPAPTGEQKLYSKVIESYRSHRSAELEKAVQILLKTYPDSVYADNALYLTGLLSFEQNDLERAQGFMERVIREYPNGNRVVTALFAKAMIEKRKQHYSEARALLESVRKLYPGSPEAIRVGLEEQNIKMAEISGKVGRTE
jgi:TolA-binding protein